MTMVLRMGRESAVCAWAAASVADVSRAADPLAIVKCAGRPTMSRSLPQATLRQYAFAHGHRDRTDRDRQPTPRVAAVAMDLARLLAAAVRARRAGIPVVGRPAVLAAARRLRHRCTRRHGAGRRADPALAALRPSARPARALVPAHVGLDAAATGRLHRRDVPAALRVSIRSPESACRPGWQLEVLAYEALKFILYYALLGGIQFGQRSYRAWADRAAAHRAAGAPGAAGAAGPADAAVAAALPVQRAEHGVVADPHRPRPGGRPAHAPGHLAARRHRRRPATGAAAGRRAGAAARLRRHHDAALRRPGRDSLGGRRRRGAVQRADARPAAAAGELLSSRRRTPARSSPMWSSAPRMRAGRLRVEVEDDGDLQALPDRRAASAWATSSIGCNRCMARRRA